MAAKKTKQTTHATQAKPAKKAAPSKAQKAQPANAATNPTPAQQYVRADMTMGEIISLYPDAALVMLSHGLHCIGCHVSTWETIEQGSMGHGMEPEEFDALMKELNELAASKHAGKKDQVLAADLRV